MSPTAHDQVLTAWVSRTSRVTHHLWSCLRIYIYKLFLHGKSQPPGVRRRRVFAVIGIDNVLARLLWSRVRFFAERFVVLLILPTATPTSCIRVAKRNSCTAFRESNRHAGEHVTINHFTNPPADTEISRLKNKFTYLRAAFSFRLRSSRFTPSKSPSQLFCCPNHSH